MGRAFDPALLMAVDEGGFGAFADDGVLVEQCHICGEDLVREVDGALVDLDGGPHERPEV